MLGGSVERDEPAVLAHAAVPALGSCGGSTAVLARPNVTGWARLHAEESATTMVMVDAKNLDEALAVAQELHETMTGGAIEVRPVREALFHGA